ncbi:MAG: hypothetical protein M3Z13_03865 [Candidatus Dormibacteraeota bacterium]|nr:hypothetical protein [Candidatus Dormibacteraeota bacterium]
MSFSIDRFKSESRKLDTTGVAWDKIRDHSLSKGDLFFLHYAMDVENHVPLYLSHLLVTRACMNPVITAFLSCWAYEELWHGENLSRFLQEYGIPLDNDTRIRNIRSEMGLSNSLSLLSTMVASWALEDFAALYLTIGATNELSTATAYGALARKCEHPVLQDLLARIQKDERRHFAFYYNSAKDWLTDNPRAQQVTRIGMRLFWEVVGKGVKTDEEVDAVSLFLFDDDLGLEEVTSIDEKISRLPGLQGISLMRKAREVAMTRAAANPRWGWRLIDDEVWAVKSEEHNERLLAGQLFGAQPGVT